MASVCLPKLSAQLAETREEGSLQLAINYGGEDERRLTSHEGVIEPLAMVHNQLQPVTLLCARERAGQPVTLSPLDGRVEIVVEGETTAIDSSAPALVGDEGTVNFTLKAPLPGKYRIQVTIGADQYQLQLYVCKIATSPDPVVTPPPN
jgi:hypothetical protein